MSAPIMSEIQAEDSKKAAERIISNSKELMAAPPIVFKLMSLLKKTTSHNRDVVDVIRYDENLTAKLLKLCNAAFFRPSMPADSIDRAVLILGSSNILSVVAALSINESSDKSKQSVYMNPYDVWRQSVTASIAAKELSSRCKNVEIGNDIAFTTALMHNIGMVVLNVCSLEEVSQIMPTAREKGISLIEAEREILGTDHTEIGALLIERWQLPAEIVEAIRYQHTPNQSPNPLPSLCHFAGLCTHISTGLYPIEQLKDFAYPSAFELLGLTEEDIHVVVQTIKDESSKIEAFMMVA